MKITESKQFKIIYDTHTETQEVYDFLDINSHLSIIAEGRVPIGGTKQFSDFKSYVIVQDSLFKNKKIETMKELESIIRL